ncbi:MAG: HAMP domain-containing protein [Deltaproteobacteria bacterium]|nr:HAMP domain-containing protein [Deltaproteobacteria bacterium]
MFSRIQSLKTNIAVQLAFLFILAIMLSDLAVVSLVEKKLVKATVSNSISRLELLLEKPGITGNPIGDIREFFPVQPIRTVYAELPGIDGKPLSLGRLDPGLEDLVKTVKTRAALRKKNEVVFAGREWGVFWLQEKYALIAVFSQSNNLGVAVLDFSLMYEMLRSCQKVAFLFLGLNFMVFWLLGTFRMARIITRPIHRYVKITESFSDTGHFDVFPEKKDDEFSRLSIALNRMLTRIEDDTGRLKASLADLEQANRKLKEAGDEMVRAEKLASVGRLSAGIAHEIGNPIGIILGYIGLIENRLSAAGDAESLDFLKRAESEITRINRIIRQLLDFSRGIPEPANTKVSVHSLIKDVSGFVGHQPLTAGIRIKHHLNAEFDQVCADYDQLYQVMTNLVINAADSIAISERKDKREIGFATRLCPVVKEEPGEGRRKYSRWIEINVIDNGNGISSEDMDKIFDPFFSTKATGKGTGLGLSVSYMIIERFGGSMSVKSTPGMGTTMKILLPVCEEKDRDEAGEHGA